MVERLLGAGLIETHHPSVNDLSDSVADQVRLLKKGLREHPVLFKAFVKWGERFGPKSNP